MKWQGRSESTNVIDLRGITHLDIQWIDSITMKGKDILIGTDGKMLDGSANPMINNQAFKQSGVAIGIVAYNLYNPVLLPVQAVTLRKVLMGMLYTGREITMSSKSGSLQEKLYAIRALLES